MLIEEIRPKIRFADKLEYTARRRLSKTYDSRMLYIIEGSGRMTVGGTDVTIERGLLIIFQSGTAYKYTPTPSFSALAIDFDPIGDYETDTGFYTPVSPQVFDESKKHEHAFFNNSEILSEPFIEIIRPSVAENIRVLVDEFKSEKPFCKARSELMLAAIILDLARRFSTAGKSERTATKVNAYLSEHYLEPITNTTLAKVFGHDACYLNRIVKQYTGFSIHKLLLKKRIDEGIKLLISTDLTLEEIAERCCFCSAAHFSRRCKDITGNTPSYYRKNAN